MTGAPPPNGTGPPDPAALGQALAHLRSQIQEIDQVIVRLLARRVQLARDTRVIKHASGLPAVDRDREHAVMQRVAEFARAEGVSESDIERLFTLVIEMARSAQNESADTQVDRM
ncbi:MAG: chorismate mutase [Gemmatimonadaceae bacterium]